MSSILVRKPFLEIDNEHMELWLSVNFAVANPWMLDLQTYDEAPPVPFGYSSDDYAGT